MNGSADCPREGCPSKDHFVWFEYNDAFPREVIRTIFECMLCGAIDDGQPDISERAIHPPISKEETDGNISST